MIIIVIHWVIDETTNYVISNCAHKEDKLHRSIESKPDLNKCHDDADADDDDDADDEDDDEEDDDDADDEDDDDDDDEDEDEDGRSRWSRTILLDVCMIYLLLSVFIDIL